MYLRAEGTLGLGAGGDEDVTREELFLQEASRLGDTTAGRALQAPQWEQFGIFIRRMV